MKFYLLGSRESRDMIGRVSASLEEAGHTCTFRWFNPDDYREGFNRPEVAAELDKMGVSEANVVVALLPAGLMSHWELGMAHAWGKPILLIDIKSDGYDRFDPSRGDVFYHLREGVSRAVITHSNPDLVVGLAAKAILSWFERLKNMKGDSLPAGGE